MLPFVGLRQGAQAGMLQRPTSGVQERSQTGTSSSIGHTAIYRINYIMHSGRYCEVWYPSIRYDLTD